MLLLPENENDWVEAGNISADELLAVVYTKCEASAREFSSRSMQTVTENRSLYIGQREMAVVNGESGINVVGSDDATTCHVVILRHRDTCTVAVAHFDNLESSLQTNTFMSAVLNALGNISEIRLDLYIVGGFNDSYDMSQRLSASLLHSFNNYSVAGKSLKLYLHFACITNLNSVTRPSTEDTSEAFPIFYGAACNVRTGDVFPSSFTFRGPEERVRSTRTFFGEQDLTSIFNMNTKRVSIGPFSYDFDMYTLQTMARASDDLIRQRYSTSPNAEPPTFSEHVRETAKWALANPDWQAYFANSPKEYCTSDSGAWVAYNSS